MRFLVLCVFASISLHVASYAQTCTLTGTGTINWTNPGPACQEGGVTPGTASVLVIPAGLTVVFDSNGDTWTGVRIDVYGTLQISEPSGSTINASIRVKSTGTLYIESRLYLGTTADCGYNIGVETGGVVDIDGNASDRLYICGNNIAQAGGGCNPYPAGPTPYCVPGGGFTGPTGFDEDGANGSLPVTWLSFNLKNIDNKSVLLTWSTATEINSETFFIERSHNGSNFAPVGSVPAAGTSVLRKDYAFTDEHPNIGRTYYRLRQTDFDGAFTYSNIRHIDLTGKRSVLVYPNPVENDEFKFRLNFSTEGNSIATVYDISGHAIRSYSFSGTEFTAPAGLEAGSYLLKVKTPRESLMCRFIVR